MQGIGRQSCSGLIPIGKMLKDEERGGIYKLQRRAFLFENFWVMC